jgi:hypothetical protein
MIASKDEVAASKETAAKITASDKEAKKED